jgi:hypothetical protein
MSRYEQLWTVSAGAACAGGFIAAFHSWSVVVLMGVLVTAGLFGVVVAMPWILGSPRWAERLAVAFVGGGLATWVLLGLGRLAGAAGLTIAVLLIVTSPWAVDGCRYLAVLAGAHLPRRRRTVGLATAPEAAVPPAPVELVEESDFDVPDLMSDADLCHAWRSSFVALQRASSPESRLRVVRMRALYLDELERRAGPAVRAWLDSGARAASDPGRFLDRT